MPDTPLTDDQIQSVQSLVSEIAVRAYMLGYEAAVNTLRSASKMYLPNYSPELNALISQQYDMMVGLLEATKPNPGATK